MQVSKHAGTCPGGVHQTRSKRVSGANRGSSIVRRTLFKTRVKTVCAVQEQAADHVPNSQLQTLREKTSKDVAIVLAMVVA